MTSHLDLYVGRRAESVEPDPLRVSRHSKRAVTDQASAKQWRRLQVRESLRHSKTIATIDKRKFGETAVDPVARKYSPAAEVLPAAAARQTLPAGPSQPRRSDPVSRGEAPHLPPNADYNADNLVTRNQWRLQGGQLSIDDVEVGPA